MKIIVAALHFLVLLMSQAANSQTIQHTGSSIRWKDRLSPQWMESLSEAFGSAPATITVKRLRLRTGVTLEFAEQGAPSAVPILLVHGFPDSWRSYEQVMTYLPNNQHVIAVSLRGHGDSESADSGYTARQLAADLAMLVQQLELPPALVVGHSMGSVVAQQFVIDYPQHVKGLLLEGGFPRLKHRTMFGELLEMSLQMRDPVDSVFIREFQQSTVVMPVTPAFFEILISESRKIESKVWRGVMKGVLSSDCRADMQSFRKPLLLIWGDRDEIALRSDQEFFLQHVPASRILVYSGSGHSAHWEQPRRFAQDLVDFSASLQLK